MFVKLIRYQDFDGEEKMAECRFHLSKAELMKLNFRYGDVTRKMEELEARKDNEAIFAMVEDVILTAYGEKVTLPDGREVFLKDELRRQAFQSSEAFSELVMEMATRKEAVAEFVSGVVPGSMVQAIRENPEYQKLMGESSVG
jgi:hypothetical protein